MAKNLLYEIDALNEWNHWLPGLSKFEQTNCQCSLTKNGYRIYRPANLTVSNDKFTMFGGLVIQPWEIPGFSMEKGHTYTIMFDIMGKTSNAPVFYWSNNVGWESDDLKPQCEYDSNNIITTKYQSYDYVTFRCEFTINDDIFKQCTKSYGKFRAGEYYNSYKEFFFGFTYRSTGQLGTDIYIRNIRMYDLTKDEQLKALAREREIEQTRNLNVYTPEDPYRNEPILGAKKSSRSSDEPILGAGDGRAGSTSPSSSNNTKADISRMGVFRLSSLQEKDAIVSAGINYTGEVYSNQFYEI